MLRARLVPASTVNPDVMVSSIFLTANCCFTVSWLGSSLVKAVSFFTRTKSTISMKNYEFKIWRSRTSGFMTDVVIEFGEANVTFRSM
jgi:hypothetical protein